MQSTVSTEEGWYRAPDSSQLIGYHSFTLQLRTTSLMKDEDDLVRPLSHSSNLVIVTSLWFRYLCIMHRPQWIEQCDKLRLAYYLRIEEVIENKTQDYVQIH